jgi:hypothetical protein
VLRQHDEDPRRHSPQVVVHALPSHAPDSHSTLAMHGEPSGSGGAQTRSNEQNPP